MMAKKDCEHAVAIITNIYLAILCLTVMSSM